MNDRPTRWVTAVSLLVLASCGERAPTDAPKKRGAGPVSVVVANVTASELTYLVEGNGSLEAYQVLTVAALVEGRVEQVDFDEGDAVTPTKTLAVIDATRRGLQRSEADADVKRADAAVPTAAAGLARAQAAIARANAQQKAAETDLVEAKGMLARREAIRAQTPGAVSQEDLATMQSEVARRVDAVAVAAAAVRETEVALIQARSASAEIDAAAVQARAKLATATRVADDTVVRPPVAGVVRRRLVTLGQYVRAGDPVAEIVDRSRLLVRFRVSEAESVRVAKDMPATFRVPSLSEKAYAARIVHVDESASPVTRTVECLALVTEDEPALKPGFYALASVETKVARAISVPEDALQPGDKGWVAFVVEKDKAVRRVLSIGLRSRSRLVEVVSGLKEGDRLVVKGANILTDGSAVVIVPAADVPPPPAAPPAMEGGAR